MSTSLIDIVKSALEVAISNKDNESIRELTSLLHVLLTFNQN